MRTFYYYDSNEVRLGDSVRGPLGRIGRVDLIIHPGSIESKYLDCPDGGVLFDFSLDGVKSLELMEPPDGRYWEDIEFLGRACAGD